MITPCHITGELTPRARSDHGPSPGRAAGRPRVAGWRWAVLFACVLSAAGGPLRAQPADAAREAELQRLLPRTPDSADEGSRERPSGSEQGAAGAAGEDLGQSADETASALLEIRRRMELAERLLRQRQTSRETQGQQEAAAEEMRRLIERLSQQQSAAPSAAPQVAATDRPPDAGPPDPGPPDEPPDPAGDPPPAASAAVQRVWGHLPPRLRERMRTTGVEPFLPQYEAMLEAYYKRLAEKPLDRP